jgi:glycerol-3-phosphate dehydrogenase (NAD(P)+)
MSERAVIVGDGAMGTLCAHMLAENGLAVRLWSAFPDAAAELARTRVNRRFLPEVRLDERIEITGTDAGLFDRADWAVQAVPTQFARGVWGRLAPHCPAGLAVCSVAKGIETGTLLTPTQIVRDVLDGRADSDRPVAALSGPSIAPEVAEELPASVAVAATDDALAERMQRAFTRPYFRVYTNPDLPGLELAGASKNVIAIAAGILDGMSAGVNAKAALLTRGIVEISRLAEALGARAETLSGLAGLGDLVTTCFSPVGRNRSFGEAIGRGQSPAEALAATESVVEGAATTEGLLALAGRAGVEMPITRAIHAVIAEGKPPADAIADLMKRPLKAEA